MKGPMFEEIKSFYYKVRNEGMFLEDYIDQKRHLRNKIDNLLDEKLDIARILCYTNKIDKNQYIVIKNKIENARVNYKRLVACC